MNKFEKLLAGFAFSNPASTDTNSPVRSIVISGENPDIDAGTLPETVWEPGSTYVFPTASGTVSIVSSSTNDTSAGTGARYILIEGLTSAYVEQSEALALNGTTPVVSSLTYFRVNSLRVVLSGSGQTNAGNITATLDSKTVRYIATAESLDHTAVYTVPADHTLFINSNTYSTIRSTGSAIVSISSNVYIPSTNTKFQSSIISIEDSAIATRNDSLSMPRIPEKSDYWLNVESSTASNIQLAASARCLLVYKTWILALNRQ